MPRRGRHEAKKQYEGDEHSQAAPEHVRDVQLTATQTRVSGGLEEEPDDEDGAHRGYQEGIEQPGLGGADRATQAEKGHV